MYIIEYSIFIYKYEEEVKSRYFYLKIELFGFHMLSTIPPEKQTQPKHSNLSKLKLKYVPHILSSAAGKFCQEQ